MSGRIVIKIWALLSFLAATTLPANAGHLDVGFPPDGLGLSWMKEPGTRLDFGGDPAGTSGFHTPYVFRFPDGTLRMYYDAFGTGQMRSATSADGLVWAKESGARLSGGPAHPHVLGVSDSLFRMYFEGPSGIGSATSADGLSWTTEVGLRLPGGADPVVLELPGGRFRMYFRSGVQDTNIRSAFSSDGLTWAVEPGIRISDAREFGAIRLPDGTVVIYYGKGTPDFIEILSARSSDGLFFSTDPGARLLPGGPPGLLDGGRILTTSLLQFPDGVLRMYYQGSPSSNINNPARVFSAIVVVPEPPPLLLVGSLLAGLAGIAWGRRGSG